MKSIFENIYLMISRVKDKRNKNRLSAILIALLFIAAISMLIINIYWLGFLLLFLLGSMLAIILKPIRKKRYAYPLGLLFIILMAIILRTGFFEVFLVPSNSMENTIMPGDVILASKLTYGPRMPYSVYEIPWLNLGYFLFTSKENRMEADVWDYNRLKGIGKVKLNDIVVFNGPFGGKNSTVLVKRCKGLPGDTIAVRNGNLLVNGQEEKNDTGIKRYYAINTSNRDSFNNLLQKHEMPAYASTKEIPWVYNISLDRYNQLSSSGLIDSSYLVPAWGNYSDSLFNLFGDFRWTRNDYGPVIIPARGMEIELDSVNFITYRKVILLYEKENIRFGNDTCLINDVPRKTYIFKHNYYWMMGDNRYESMDSRSWGFVPELNIIGKASRVIYSSNNGAFKWNRILKQIK